MFGKPYFAIAGLLSMGNYLRVFKFHIPYLFGRVVVTYRDDMVVGRV